jgi:hypothetical protein
MIKVLVIAVAKVNVCKEKLGYGDNICEGEMEDVYRKADV